MFCHSFSNIIVFWFKFNWNFFKGPVQIMAWHQMDTKPLFEPMSQDIYIHHSFVIASSVWILSYNSPRLSLSLVDLKDNIETHWQCEMLNMDHIFDSYKTPHSSPHMITLEKKLAMLEQNHTALHVKINIEGIHLASSIHWQPRNSAVIY